HALPPIESTAHGRNQHRIRRFSENQESRVECPFLRIPAESRDFFVFKLHHKKTAVPLRIRVF
ncbi:MAG: hypothetical protein ABSG46_16265, partial [Candidatus Binataceae bacterium]